LAKAKAEGHDISLEIVENILIDKQKTTHFYEGAIISALLRAHLQINRADFSFETVMSHPSKIDFIQTAKKNGYKTYLYFICIDDPEINISRVKNRVDKGGHPVSATKIERRYFETLSQLMAAIESCDTTFLFDNSGKGLKIIAKIMGPSLELLVEPVEFPNWFLTYVLPYYQIDGAEKEGAGRDL
jgi:predicted ABC-type ATPase